MNNNEFIFARKVRHALNQSLDDLPASVIDRLVSARNVAIKRKKKRSLLETWISKNVLPDHIGNFFKGTWSWSRGIGFAVPVILAAVGLLGIYQSEKQKCLAETAEIEAQIMADKLPLTAYLDNGFSTYLDQQQE